jgi:hypothetical protein
MSGAAIPEEILNAGFLNVKVFYAGVLQLLTPYPILFLLSA